MSQPTSLIAIVIALAIVIPIVLLISAVLLRAGVALYNRLVGGPNSPSAVPQPSMQKALGITLLVGAINYGIGASLGLGAELAADFGMQNFGWLEAANMAGSTVIGVLIMAAVLKYMLPTLFVRALRVSLCHLIVCVAVGIVVLVVGVTGGIALSATM